MCPLPCLLDVPFLLQAVSVNSHLTVWFLTTAQIFTAGGLL